MLKVGVTQAQVQGKGLVSNETTQCLWTVMNVGDVAFEPVEAPLLEASGCVAPPVLLVPGLRPGETAQVGTEIQVTEGSGDVKLVYALEVWAGEQGQLCALQLKGTKAPKKALDAQICFAPACQDVTDAVLAANPAYAKALTQAVAVVQTDFGLVLRNTGREALPAGTKLQLCCGAADQDAVVFDHCVQPGELFHVQLPQGEDCTWVLTTPEGACFGVLLEVPQTNDEAVSEAYTTDDWELATDAQSLPSDIEVVAEPSPADEELSAEELQVCLLALEQMGFTHHELNAALLMQYKDIVTVIEVLHALASQQ